MNTEQHIKPDFLVISREELGDLIGVYESWYEQAEWLKDDAEALDSKKLSSVLEARSQELFRCAAHLKEILKPLVDRLRAKYDL